MANRVHKVRNQIDGRVTEMSNECFIRQMPKYHQGVLYEKNGWEIIPAAPEVSKEAADLIEEAKVETLQEFKDNMNDVKEDMKAAEKPARSTRSRRSTKKK